MLDLLVDASIRAAVAAAAVALVLRLLAVRSAALRHAAWSGVLVVMLTMPVLTRIVPAVPLPVPSRLAVDLGTIARDEPWPYTSVSTAPPSPTNPAAPQPLPMSASSAADVSEPLSPRLFGSVDWVALIYAVGVLCLGLRLAAGYWMTRRLFRTGVPVTPDGSGRFIESPVVNAPLTVGVLRPRIVLPSAWREWTAGKLRAVLAHEGAHVRRRDGLVRFIAEVNRVVFWFHPLAWWLPPTIAAHAEHACDDEARTVVGGREYAHVLLEIAGAVSARGRRVAWQALGVEGSGSLGARIERLVRADAPAHPSRMTVALTGLACSIVLAGAVACRREPPPLQPDPELARQYAEQAQSTSEFQAVVTMSLEEVDALERRIDADPNDWEAREKLVTYYRAGTKVPWERKVAGLRKHALWLVEHHPEHDIAAPPLSPVYDPAGFAQAVRLWDQHLQKPDASPFLVYRAARFFAAYDMPRAEQLILRGMAMDPNSEALTARMPPRVGGYQWPIQLAGLYSSALLGSEGYFPSGAYHPTRAASPFAQDVRRKLAESRDARVLSRVGSSIVMARFKGEPVEELRTLGREYLERAVQIDPQLESARTMLSRAERSERHERIFHAIREGGDVPDADRLLYLANKASWAYMQLESWESWRRTKEPEKAEEEARKAHAEAKKAAEDLLALAAERRHSPDYAAAVNTAHQTLGLIALHDGDRDRAVYHMLESVKVPDIESTDGILEFVAQRLPTYLLKEGERETVIQYYEAAAKINPRERDRLLEDAQAVREGRMPRNYQSTFARAQ